MSMKKAKAGAFSTKQPMVTMIDEAKTAVSKNAIALTHGRDPFITIVHRGILWLVQNTKNFAPLPIQKNESKEDYKDRLENTELQKMFVLSQILEMAGDRENRKAKFELLAALFNESDYPDKLYIELTNIAIEDFPAGSPIGTPISSYQKEHSMKWHTKDLAEELKRRNPKLGDLPIVKDTILGDTDAGSALRKKAKMCGLFFKAPGRPIK